MLKISGNKISLTRGDSAYITLSIDDYELNDGDVVRVQVRDIPNTGELLVEGDVDVSGEEIVWHIYPYQTSNLEVKTYYWDAQLETSNGDIFTFIPASPFKLLDEVTMPNG
jgi:hypothetical protein